METKDYELILHKVIVSPYDVIMYFSEGELSFDITINYCVHKHKQYMFISSNSQQDFLTRYCNHNNILLQEVLIDILNKKIPDFPLTFKEYIPF